MEFDQQSDVLSRMALRSTISQMCRTVHELSEADNRRGEAISLAQLASLFRQLEKLPFRTELEENDAERISVILYLVERRRPDLWKLFPAQMIGMLERRERWRPSLMDAPEYITTAIHQEDNVLRVECLSPLIGPPQVAELMRAIHLGLIEDPARDVILDLVKVRAAKAQGIAYLLFLSEICKVANGCATIATGVLREKILRLLPQPLPIVESVDECYALLALRAETRRLGRLEKNAEGE